jgi:CO/xanthine dehydrogenase FAD-binding subunit
MYSASFDYYRARSVAEARTLMAAHPGAKLLAGGHSLIPLLKLRLAAPAAVIDIGRVAELRGIEQKGDDLAIGALTTHAELAASAHLRSSATALADAASIVGDPAVRNRGTIGGNVAHADPASDLPTALVALNARMVAVGPGGERTVAADEFFTGLMATALADDEILVNILVPRLNDTASVGVHDVDVIVATRATIARERNLVSVRRPRGVEVVGRVTGELQDPAAVRIHGVDLEVSVAVADERDPPVVAGRRGAGHAREERERSECEN